MTKRKTNYLRWLENKQLKDELKTNLEKAGFPLELRTRNLFSELGYRVNPIRYIWPEDVLQKIYWHQLPESNLPYRDLDIFAHKNVGYKIKLDENREIVFSLNFVGDCKYHSSKDFLMFEQEKELLSNFPVAINGEKLICPRPDEYFKFPMRIERVVEWNRESFDKKNNNFSDKDTHFACEQIMAASCYKFLQERQYKRMNYINTMKMSSWYSIYEQKANEAEFKRIETPPGSACYKLDEHQVLDFIKRTCPGKAILKDFDYLQVDLIVPILIVDEGSGVIKVELQKGKNQFAINDFKEVGFGLYNYVPEYQSKYDTILKGKFTQPIVFCNFKYLEECIKEIEEGTLELVKDAEKKVDRNPHILFEELMFTDVMSVK